MPKAYDIKRNYYADLELPQNASIDDIKKQYRKLAFLWHPDRNAGKEEECVPRFQAIQAAHEILSDPAQKAQYDADRRVSAPFASSYATQSQPPPPPQRGNPYQAKSNFPPPPRRTQPGTYQRPSRPPASGADRFSNFTGAQPPPKQPSTSSERVNAFQAWQNMKTQQKAKQQEKDEAAANTSRPSTPGNQNPPRRRPQPPPRNDTQYPHDQNAARNNFRSHDDADNAASRQTAWEALNKQQSMPGMRRSNTARTPRKQGFDPNAPGSDERPAGNGNYMHRHRSEDFGQPNAQSGPTSMPSPPTMRRPHIDPTNPHRREPEDVPFSEANRVRTPYSSATGERTDFSGIRRSKSSRDTTTLGNQPSSNLRPQSTTPTGTTNRPATFEFPQSVDSDASTSPLSSPESYESPFVKPPTVSRPEDRPKKVPSPPSKRYNGSQAPPQPPFDVNEQPKQRRNIFEFANGVPFVPPSLATGKSRSEEHINTKFAEDFDGTFSSQGTTSPSRPTSRTYNRQNSKTRATPTFGQPSPLSTNLPPMDIPPPPSHPPTSAPGSAATAQTFSPEVWAAHFADGSWVAPPPPARNNTGETANDTKDGRDPTTVLNESDEMDIDTETPAQTVDPSEASEHAASMPLPSAQAMPPPPRPRMVPIPPSQWHQEQSENHARAKQALDSDLGTNLDDFRHVEPLTREEGSGLDSLKDVSADLPFKSQAAQAVPVKKADMPPEVIPLVPKAPVGPQVITNQTWAHYATEFARYVSAFHTFNGYFTKHFSARQAAMESKNAGGMDWLVASGDLASVGAGKGPAGVAAYIAETERDLKLRETWSIGCEKHLTALQTFDAVREKVRRLSQAGGLVGR